MYQKKQLEKKMSATYLNQNEILYSKRKLSQNFIVYIN